MSNYLYYGEIAARISAKLYVNFDEVTTLHDVVSDPDNPDGNLCILCADAARVFSQIEDLCSDHFIDWPAALDEFTELLRDHLLSGVKPTIPDMVTIAAQSISMQTSSVAF